ncbi:MAG: ParB/RepB/Spo0J family partition protein [Chloroflexi bacterium]|nr:ParB/RepB/Spo0J family partition protein [Chloroflexota bacterium]
MSKKRGLGRGLNALIPTVTSDESGGVQSIPITAIIPNPHQPRTHMDEEKLTELASSINEHGLIQPLIVTQQGNQFILIAGERRWRASQKAGLESVPVIVKEATPQEMLELALIENIQRADLNPLEEAYAYQQLMDEFDLTQEDVAKRVGKGRSTVANLVRLLNLPANIQQAVSDGEISGAHGRALLPLPTSKAQTAAMNLIIELGLNVRQTESLVKNLSLLPTPEAQIAAMNQIVKLGLNDRQTETLVKNLLADEKPKPKPRPTLPPELADLQKQFRTSLGAKVNIEKSGKGGRVVIHYYNDDDLQAIYDAIIQED